jgi:PAS domain S-box-containing protein
VFVYDENLNIKFFNKAAEVITGHKKENVLGKKRVTIFDQTVCLNNCELCQTVKLGKRREVQFQSPFLCKDGTRRLGNFKAGLLRKNSQGGTEVLVSLTDITELVQLRNEVKGIQSFRQMVGKSPKMKDLFHTIRNVAAYDSTLFLHGESGTGKELVASAIHHESRRSSKNLVKVNCSSFSESLLESELFGHVRGAFTGAIRERIGRFEEADGGTVLLDEVGDLSPMIQVKLLRVLQEKEIERVGENITRKVDIRIIAATNKDIAAEVARGNFREDLFYRLNVIPIHLPPLRDRKEDIPLLVEHFLNQWKTKNKTPTVQIKTPALGKLMEYHWPGNIRQLENALEHACVKMSQSKIEVEDLPVYLQASQGTLPPRKRKRKRLTKKLVQEALTQCGHNQSKAALLLDVHRITLWRKMKEFNIPGRPLTLH